jgi:hypothetical protein
MRLGMNMGVGSGGGAAPSKPYYDISSDGGDYSEAAHNVAFDPGTGHMTLMYWQNISSTSDGVVTKRDGTGWQTNMTADGYASVGNFFPDGNFTTAGTTDIRNAWHHVAVVWDRTAAKLYLYVDAVSEGTPATIPSGDLTFDVALTFCADFGGGFSITGELTQIRLGKGVARTAGQVSTDRYNAGIIGWETDYWRMEPGTGTVIDNPISGRTSTFAVGANAPSWGGPYTRITAGGPV